MPTLMHDQLLHFMCAVTGEHTHTDTLRHMLCHYKNGDVITKTLSDRRAYTLHVLKQTSKTIFVPHTIENDKL